MKNKLLVNVSLPTIEMDFDLYIPYNKKIGTIKQNIITSIVKLTNDSFNLDFQKVKLIDKETGIEYENDMCIKDSGIKNGSKLIII